MLLNGHGSGGWMNRGRKVIRNVQPQTKLESATGLFLSYNRFALLDVEELLDIVSLVWDQPG